jgi:hypothetical protein
VSLRAKLLAKISGAAILPDNRIVDRLAGLTIPHDRGLALIRNTNGCHVVGLCSGLRQGLDGDRDLGTEDLFWIVFDPSGLGKDLLELLLSHGADGTIPIEQESPGTGRALI